VQKFVLRLVTPFQWFWAGTIGDEKKNTTAYCLAVLYFENINETTGLKIVLPCRCWNHGKVFKINGFDDRTQDPSGVLCNSF